MSSTTTRCRTCRHWIVTPDARQPVSRWQCPKCGNDVRAEPQPKPAPASVGEPPVGVFAGTAFMAFCAFAASQYDTALAWLVAVVMMAVVVDSWRTALAARAAAGGTIAGVLATPVQRLEIALGCVAAGLGLVVLAELALWLTGAISADTVSAAERGLSDARAAIERRIGPGTLLLALAGATLVAMIAPALRPVRWFGMLSDGIGRAMLVLVTLTSFTFFGAREVSNAEPVWMATVRQQIEQQGQAQRRVAGEIAAAVIVEQQVADLPEDARAALAVYLAPTHAEARRARAAQPDMVARALAYGAPTLAATPAPQSPDAQPTTPDAPSLRELEAAAAREGTETSRLETLRTAALSAIATGLAQLVPGVDRGVVDALVKGLVSAVATEVGLRATPAFTSLAEARTWVGEATARARSAATTAAAAPAEPWRWTRADLALDPGRPSRREAAEAAAKTAEAAEARVGLVQLVRALAADPAVPLEDRAALDRMATEIARLQGANAPPEPPAASTDALERALERHALLYGDATPAEATRRWIESEFAKAGAAALLAGAAGLALRGTLQRSMDIAMPTSGRLPQPPRPSPRPPPPRRGR